MCIRDRYHRQQRLVCICSFHFYLSAMPWKHLWKEKCMYQKSHLQASIQCTVSSTHRVGLPGCPDQTHRLKPDIKHNNVHVPVRLETGNQIVNKSVAVKLRLIYRLQKILQVYTCTCVTHPLYYSIQMYMCDEHCVQSTSTGEMVEFGHMVWVIYTWFG